MTTAKNGSFLLFSPFKFFLFYAIIVGLNHLKMAQKQRKTEKDHGASVTVNAGMIDERSKTALMQLEDGELRELAAEMVEKSPTLNDHLVEKDRMLDFVGSVEKERLVEAILTMEQEFLTWKKIAEKPYEEMTEAMDEVVEDFGHKATAIQKKGERLVIEIEELAEEGGEEERQEDLLSQL
jgi:predicted Zn-ribbon and HTH transcriptional regulator